AGKEPSTSARSAGGVIIAATREAAGCIRAAIRPGTPVPASPRSVGFRELIRNHIQAAREHDPRLQPWRAAFYAEVGAALNAVICRISECSASVTSRSAT